MKSRAALLAESLHSPVVPHCVLISSLLEATAPNAEAQRVVFVAGDGFTAEAPLAEVMVCADCIVHFRNQGGFSVVMPGYPGNMQVKDVVEIQVK